jgi:hypothetical protein
MKSLTIKSAQITKENRAVLTFKELPTLTVIKPAGSVLLSLDPVSKSLARIKPDTLVGAKLTVESSIDLKGNAVPALIETFKIGDKYKVTENNTAFQKAEINPVTNAPYQIGDEAECKTNGVRINGRINLTLSDSVNSMVTNAIINQSIANVLSESTYGSPVSRVAEVAQPEEVESTEEVAEETVAIEGAQNF